MRARLEAAGLTAISADLAGTGADVEVDVTDVESVQGAADGVLGEYGRLDLVVANAGVGAAGAVEDLPPEGWDRPLAVNVGGAVNLVRAAYPTMIEQRRGHILLVASLAGLVPTPLFVPYATTKAALVGFGTSLRIEAARHGIGVTTLCPGPFESPFLDTGGATGVVAGVDTRRYLVRAAGPAMTADRVAKAALTGVERNKAIVAPGRAGTIWRAARFMPGVTARIVARAMNAELASTR